jgi:hypothetical protein
VTQLAAEKKALQTRLTASTSLGTLARDARRLSYVRPGEHLFIVKGIQAWKRAHSTIEGDGK